ncbi:hypothetical protein ACFOLF_06285 [Paenibacillus sepulcri]|uniref:Aminoglycoside phosphotransferase n=1 Tax=Paenibacillus sepulcri TaxID=359917 RepID=A0ABS7BYQ5_9BACL|nr:hypothetical protein [Paenibacillus sepulcri]
MTTRRNMWKAMEDDVTAQRLVELVRKHFKLALEHIDNNSSPERRRAIRAEIERLRVEKDCLLKSFKLEGVQ